MGSRNETVPLRLEFALELLKLLAHKVPRDSVRFDGDASHARGETLPTAASNVSAWIPKTSGHQRGCG
jgi:hypothetical protein